MSTETTETEDVTEDTATDETVDATEDDDEGAEALGDAGKQALDRTKARYKTERDKRRALETELADLRAKKPADAEDKPDLESLQRNADTAAQAKANARILRSEVKAASAGKFADPADAYKFLDLEQFEVDADGNVDEDEIAEAIDALLKTKPYLAAVQDGKRFKGGGDGGARNGSRPAQLTESDLATMTPEQINTARRDGRLNKLLGK
jgi:hypothetical protein